MPEESPTSDLVELSCRMIEADTFDEWAMLAEQVFAPNAVWDVGLVGSLDGFDAIRAFVRDYWLMWDAHHHYVEENVDLGHGVICGVIREHGRMKDSDASVEARWALVSLVAQGRVVRSTTYTDIDEGRAAAARLAESRD
jgi:ketosteroid isomerase-like protein